MIFMIPEMDMFAISYEEAKEFVRMSQSRGPEDVDVLVYNMSPMEFLMQHWVTRKELPEPNLRISLPRHANN
jgi:hypothetical protein